LAATAGPPGRVDQEVQAALTALGAALGNGLISGPNRHRRNNEEIHLRGVDLAGADLTRLDLDLVDLSRVDLRAARLAATSLSGARLELANVRDLDLRGVNLTSAKLNGADLTGANLDGVSLERAILRDAIVERADLTGVELTGAYVTGLRFTGATGLSPDHVLVFTAVTALASSAPDTRLGAITTLARYLPGAPADRADLVGIADDALLVLIHQHKGPTDTPWPPPLAADIQAPLTVLVGHRRLPDQILQLTKAHLQGANLERANLHGADLHSADLTGANLRGADLSRADLWAADLTFADLTGADVAGADVAGAAFSSDLSTVKGLTAEQVTVAHFGPNARLPAGLKRPDPTPAPTR